MSLSAARHTHRAQHAGPNIFRPGGRTGSPGEMRSMIWLNKELSKTDTPVPGGWCDINHRRNSTPDWVRRPASHSLSYRNTGSSAEMITTGLLNTGVLWSWIYPSFSSPGPAGLYRNYILNYFLTKHLFCSKMCTIFLWTVGLGSFGVFNAGLYDRRYCYRLRYKYII